MMMIIMSTKDLFQIKREWGVLPTYPFLSRTDFTCLHTFLGSIARSRVKGYSNLRCEETRNNCTHVERNH
jgi:hypothetical protein